jgi:hypothetical protein
LLQPSRDGDSSHAPKENIQMKHRMAGLLVTLLLLTGGIALAAAKANFNGTWVMDASKSVGLPPNVTQTMILTQADDTLTMENKIVTAEGDINVSDAFNISGKEVDFTQKVNGVEIKGKRTSKWSAAGDGFESNEEFTVEAGDGQSTTQRIRRVWVISADGKTLTIDLYGKTPTGDDLHTKRTFVKK